MLLLNLWQCFHFKSLSEKKGRKEKSPTVLIHFSRQELDNNRIRKMEIVVPAAAVGRFLLPATSYIAWWNREYWLKYKGLQSPILTRQAGNFDQNLTLHLYFQVTFLMNGPFSLLAITINKRLNCNHIYSLLSKFCASFSYSGGLNICTHLFM